MMVWPTSLLMRVVSHLPRLAFPFAMAVEIAGEDPPGFRDVENFDCHCSDSALRRTASEESNPCFFRWRLWHPAISRVSTTYEQITKRLIERIEQGGLEGWLKPWTSSVPTNVITGRRYRGSNRLLLSVSSYSDTRWLTFRQALSLGGNVKKGEKGTPIIFWGEAVDTDKESERTKVKTVMRTFTVFNVEQCENLDLPPLERADFDPAEDIGSHAELIVRAMPDAPILRKDGSEAYYVPSEDTIVMPPRESFASGEAYASVLFHEASHSVGHPRRLHRWDLGQTGKLASTAAYSREECVAQITAEFCCQELNISSQTEQSASYVASWLKVLREDPRSLLLAASQAEKAADWILGQHRP